MHKNGKIYYWGIVVEIASLISLSISYKGHGSEELSLIALAIGFAMILKGYIR